MTDGEYPISMEITVTARSEEAAIRQAKDKVARSRAKDVGLDLNIQKGDMDRKFLKGFMRGKLGSFMGYDKDSFIEKMETLLENIELEHDIEECVDELIEEGWIEYNEKGNNLTSSAPHIEKAEHPEMCEDEEQ